MKEHIVEVLENAVPGIDFTISETMVDDGILDSLAITSIISELCIEYGITIPFDELVSSNFNSVDNILALVERCPKSDGMF